MSATAFVKNLKEKLGTRKNSLLEHFFYRRRAWKNHLYIKTNFGVDYKNFQEKYPIKKQFVSSIVLEHLNRFVCNV